MAFLAYCLSITLRQRLKALAGGLMPRVVFEKLATLQLLDVRVPPPDGRELLLVRRTEPDRDVPRRDRAWRPAGIRRKYPDQSSG